MVIHRGTVDLFLMDDIKHFVCVNNIMLVALYETCNVLLHFLMSFIAFNLERNFIFILITLLSFWLFQIAWSCIVCMFVMKGWLCKIFLFLWWCHCGLKLTERMIVGGWSCQQDCTVSLKMSNKWRLIKYIRNKSIYQILLYVHIIKIFVLVHNPSLLLLECEASFTWKI